MASFHSIPFRALASVKLFFFGGNTHLELACLPRKRRPASRPRGGPPDTGRAVQRVALPPLFLPEWPFRILPQGVSTTRSVFRSVAKRLSWQLCWSPRAHAVVTLAERSPSVDRSALIRMHGGTWCPGIIMTEAVNSSATPCFSWSNLYRTHLFQEQVTDLHN